MKLKKYIIKLQKLAEKHPEAEVVYSKDDEGNGYQPVHFDPSAGRFEDGEWEPDDNTEEFTEKINAVCLN